MPTPIYTFAVEEEEKTNITQQQWLHRSFEQLTAAKEVVMTSQAFSTNQEPGLTRCLCQTNPIGGGAMSLSTGNLPTETKSENSEELPINQPQPEPR